MAYAAAAGTTAADGRGRRNSPYSTALLAYLEEPLELSALFRRVRGRVLEATDGRQRPHEYGSLLGEHYLSETSGSAPLAVAASVDGAAAAALVQQETVFWQSIVDSEDPANFEAYLRQFPAGVYVELARNRVLALRRVADAPPAVAETSSDPPNASETRSDPPAVAETASNPPAAATATSDDPPAVAESAIEAPALVEFNTPARGAIGGDASGSGIWVFEGELGQVVAVEATSSDFDAYVRLISPTGEEIAADDAGGRGLTSRLVATLPSSGRHQVRVTAYNGGNGAYEVAVRTAASDAPSVPSVSRPPVAENIPQIAQDLVALLGREFSASASDENRWTDLHFAAALNLPELVVHLLAEGAALDARLRHDGAFMGERLKRTLQNLDQNFDGWTLDGETPLHVAASVGAQKAAAELIAHGATLDARTPLGWTPLHYAAWTNTPGVIETLLAHGANVEATVVDDWRPLHLAVWAGSREAVRVLLARGADITAETSDGETPLALSKSPEMSAILRGAMGR